MRLQRITICSIFILIMSFCAVTGTATSAVATEPPEKLISIDPGNAPPDLVMVISAIVLEMRGQAQPKGKWPEIVFTGGITKGLLEPQFRYAGFRLLQTMVDEYLPPEMNNGVTKLKGHLHFFDAAKRRTLVSLEIKYEFVSDKIIIKKAEIRPLFPLRPELKLFIVPAERVTKNDFDIFSNNALTMGFLLNNCVSAGKPDEIPKGIRDYYVFACYLDRLSPDDQTELRLGRISNGLQGEKLAFRASDGIAQTGHNLLHFDHSGWRVDIARCRISLTGEKLYLKAIFQPGTKQNKEIKLGEPYLAGVFPTRLARQVPDPLVKKTQLALIRAGYDPGPADGFMGNKTHQAIDQFQRDSKQKAAAEPTRDQIKMVQAALVEKGYKPGTPDGIMGGKTRRAIMQYQHDNAMPADGKISASLLKKLTASKPQRTSTVQHAKKGKSQVVQQGESRTLTVSAPSPKQQRLKTMITSKMWPNEVAIP
ncbi:MAG TPA: peptidoglycan-binding domain-containing protein [Syntrophales bacterium]|nr:peptidoglycan-binding domain-containing protein [Syntrophales bacterium]